MRLKDTVPRRVQFMRECVPMPPEADNAEAPRRERVLLSDEAWPTPDQIPTMYLPSHETTLS
jgi:hypothetical protein